MTREERLAYARGYHAGKSRKWPEHIPLHPPLKVVSDLITALTAFRNQYDTELAHMNGDPDWEALYGPLIDQADAATAAVTRWMNAQISETKQP